MATPDLSERLMSAVLEEPLPLATELLIAAFLSKVDNLHEKYQKQLTGKLTKDFYYHLYHKFDISSDLNKRLIEMCIAKGILSDNKHMTVIYTMSMFGQDLQRIYGGVPSSFK